MSAVGISLDTAIKLLREKTLVDMRVLDVGNVQRVFVKQIDMRAEDADVLVEQIYHAKTSKYKKVYTYALEDIMCVEPTRVRLLDVRPIVRKRKKPDLAVGVASLGNASPILRSIIVAAAECFRIKDPLGEPYAKKCIGVALYAMTDLSLTNVAKFIGYASGAPLSEFGQTLGSNLRTGGAARQNILDICHRTDGYMGAYPPTRRAVLYAPSLASIRPYLSPTSPPLKNIKILPGIETNRAGEEGLRTMYYGS